MKRLVRSALAMALVMGISAVFLPAYAVSRGADPMAQAQSSAEGSVAGQSGGERSSIEQGGGERSATVTMQGKPITLIGPEITAGRKAPDFVAQANDLSDAGLGDFKGKVKLICSVPSVDTPVCDAEIHRFNQEASQVSSDAAIIFVSMDLPFAQKRFCAAAGISNVKTLSDHRYADFGRKYGVLIKDLRLLARAIFIIDKDNTVRYVEYVKDVGMQPDYEAALKSLKEIAGK